MLSLVVAMALAQAPLFEPRFSRLNSRTAQGRSDRGLLDDELAFFEAFPASGAGTSGACSTTAPTGAKGEALTFTRASNGTCTKTATGGLATTGIANGDLVVLSSNQPRVEYDSQGVLGLLVESSRTNSVVRSQELDNGAWIPASGGGGSAPTITANYATAPDGTMTADRLQTSACVANPSFSVAYQSYMGTAAAWATTVYIRGTSGSGTLALYSYDTTAATGTWTSCAYDASSWTRCTLQRTWANTTHRIGFGCTYDSVVYSGSSNTGANDVLVWGMSSEAGAYHTSIIPTTSATVTRSAETATFPGAAFPANPYSLAVSIYPPTGTTQGDLFYGNAGSTSGVGFFFVASLLRAQNCSSGCATFSPAFTPTALTTTRVATSSTGGQQQTFVNGSSIAGPTATAAAATPWATATGIGPGIGQPDAIISRICVDSDPSRCR